MATTTVSIGSRSDTVDTETPASSSGSGPLYVVTFGTTPTGIAVGHMGFMDTQEAGGSPDITLYQFVVTAISGANITLKYLRDNASGGDHSPFGLYTGEGSSGSPTQAPMVFKRHGLPTAHNTSGAPSYVITFSDAGPPADLDVGDIAYVNDGDSASEYEYVVTAIDLSAKTVTMKYVYDSSEGGQASPYGMIESEAEWSGEQAVIEFKRAFSTITLFEAMIDDSSPNYWGTTDDVVGECHADSTFTDNDINFEEKRSLASVTLTAVASDRHDGTAESGVLIKPTTRGTHLHGVIRVDIDDLTIEWLDISLASIPEATSPSGGTTSNNKAIWIQGNGDNTIIRNNVLHDDEEGRDSGSNGPVGIAGTISGATSDSWYIFNNIIYNFIETDHDSAAGIMVRHFQGNLYIYNNTIYKIKSSEGGTKDGVGMRFGADADNVAYIKNNIVIGLECGNPALTAEKIAYIKEGSGSTLYSANNLSGDGDYSNYANTTVQDAEDFGQSVNDSTALTGKTLAQIDFVSTVSGSEDLHLDTDSVCRGAGADLGTTNEVNIDIDSVDRDATGVTWDIGADQASAAESSGSPAFILFVD